MVSEVAVENVAASVKDVTGVADAIGISEVPMEAVSGHTVVKTGMVVVTIIV